MKPSERLKECEEDLALYKKKHPTAFTDEASNYEWLIARIKRLEEALQVTVSNMYDYCHNPKYQLDEMTEEARKALEAK